MQIRYSDSNWKTHNQPPVIGMVIAPNGNGEHRTFPFQPIIGMVPAPKDGGIIYDGPVQPPAPTDINTNYKQPQITNSNFKIEKLLILLQNFFSKFQR